MPIEVKFVIRTSAPLDGAFGTDGMGFAGQ